MISKLLIAALLVAHGAIHAGYIAPRPAVSAGGPTWPFALESSCMLGPLQLDVQAMRLVGLALTGVTIVGFTLAALAGVGLLPGALWIAGASVGAVASVALLVVFFHPWLVVGLLIDAAVLWVVLIARWEPGS